MLQLNTCEICKETQLQDTLLTSQTLTENLQLITIKTYKLLTSQTWHYYIFFKCDENNNMKATTALSYNTIHYNIFNVLSETDG